MNGVLRLANYMSRYAPSRHRVLEYLQKKKNQNPEQVLLDIGYDESLMCDMWIRSFLAIGKGQQEITMKLVKKAFPKEMIEEKLSDFSDEIHDWEIHRSSIVRQIHTLRERGKSKRILLSTLVSRYPYFRDQIQELVSPESDLSNLEKEVQKYKNRYTLFNKKIQEKMIASLLRKGFSYADIKSHLI